MPLANRCALNSKKGDFLESARLALSQIVSNNFFRTGFKELSNIDHSEEKMVSRLQASDSCDELNCSVLLTGNAYWEAFSAVTDRWEPHQNADRNFIADAHHRRVATKKVVKALG